jgi:hypothetical protein
MGSNGVEKDKIKFINYTMDEIHDSLSIIYESFIDNEYPKVTTEVKKTISILNALKESIQDEI